MNHDQKKSFDLSCVAYELLKKRLPVEDRWTAREYIYDVNEWGLGLETIVDTLNEEDISISLREKDAVLKAMEAMEIERPQLKLRLSE